jgi:hypothetical protein
VSLSDPGQFSGGQGQFLLLVAHASRESPCSIYRMPSPPSTIHSQWLMARVAEDVSRRKEPEWPT